MYFIQRFIDEKKTRWLLVASFGMSIQVIIGQFQQALYTDIFVFVYLIIFAIVNKHKILTLFKNIILWIVSYIAMSALQLIPTLGMFMYYSGAASASTTSSYFYAFSFQLNSIVEMLNPMYIGILEKTASSIQPANNNMEMVEELYLGIFIVIALIAILIKYHDVIYIKVSSILLLVTYCFMCIGSFPVIRVIIARIPVIGSMRVSPRAILIFVFLAFSVVAVGLNRANERGELKELSSLSRRIIVVLWMASTVGIIGNLVVAFAQKELNAGTISYISEKTMIPAVVSVVLFCILLFFERFKKLSFNQTKLLVLGIVCVMTIAEVYPSFIAATYTDENILENDTEQEVMLHDIAGDYTVLDASESWDDGQYQLLQNFNLGKDVAVANAYTPFNNTYLHRLLYQGNRCAINSTGSLTLLTRSEQAYDLLRRNDIISMLGVGYIVDADDVIANTESYSTGNITCTSLLNINEEIELSEYDESIDVFAEQLPIQANTIYRVTVTLSEDTDRDYFVVDLFANSNYNSSYQEAVVQPNESNDTYICNIYSGDTSQAANDPIYIRVFNPGNTDISISSITVEECVAEGTNSYQLAIPSSDTYPAVYENPDVNEILSVPESISTIENSEDFYSEDCFNVDDIAYLLEEDGLLPTTINRDAISITDINFTNNQVTAHVSANEAGFVMFAQMYYPGWEFYVDGQKVDIYQVNQSIMGGELPQGEYDICFKYVPYYTYVGYAISAVAILVAVAYSIYEYRRDKRVEKITK